MMNDVPSLPSVSVQFPAMCFYDIITQTQSQSVPWPVGLVVKKGGKFYLLFFRDAVSIINNSYFHFTIYFFLNLLKQSVHSVCPG